MRLKTSTGPAELTPAFGMERCGGAVGKRTNQSQAADIPNT